MFDVVVIGSANLDLVARTDRHPLPGETVLGDAFDEFAGGKGLNQAVAAARCGASVQFIGAVGDDDAGRRLTAIAAAEGIDTSRLASITDEPSGRALIVVGTNGENSIVVIPGANRLVAGNNVPAARVVLAQLEIPTATVQAAFSAARQAGAATVLNPAPALELPESLLALCDVVIPNEHEIELLGGVDRLLAAGVDTVIVTRGAAGVSVFGPDGASADVPALDVDVVDTTGAGDAFCGNFAARLAAGDDAASATRWAAAAGALAVTTAGATPSLPHHSAVASLIASQR